MSEFIVGGSFERALTHFAGLGIAGILEDRGYRDLRMRWTEDEIPAFVVDVSGADTRTVATEVRDHAARHAEPDSWVQQTVTITSKNKASEIGLFSPRIAAPDSVEEWCRLYANRRQIQDAEANRGWLDAQLLQSIGEPAYWQFGDTNPRYDEGASRWEMKTRNRGEDFTRNRLSLLAASVSSRDPKQIEGGLTGATVDDSKGGPDSRTGTGLVSPGSVDDALAWCALWGIGAFPLYRRKNGIAVTPGASPDGWFHTKVMTLPMWTRPLSPAKVRRIIRSWAFAVAASQPSDGRGEVDRLAAHDELAEHGICGVMRFPVRKAGSTSAPERQVLAGVYEAFGG